MLSMVTRVPCIAASPLGVPTPPSPSAAEAAYRRGLESLGNHDLREAATAFKEAAQLAPEAPQPLLGLADIALTQGQPQQAETYLQQALTVAPQQLDV